MTTDDEYYKLESRKLDLTELEIKTRAALMERDVVTRERDAVTRERDAGEAARYNELYANELQELRAYRSEILAEIKNQTRLMVDDADYNQRVASALEAIMQTLRNR